MFNISKACCWLQLRHEFVFLRYKQSFQLFTVNFKPKNCIINVTQNCTAQLVLWRQPCLRSNCLDQPVYCNETGWKLPAPLVSCSSAVPCDIHLPSLVWLVNLDWREVLPLLITSAQRAAFSSMNGHGKTMPLSSQPDSPFESQHPTPHRISSISILAANMLMSAYCISAGEFWQILRSENNLI